MITTTYLDVLRKFIKIKRAPLRTSVNVGGVMESGNIFESNFNMDFIIILIRKSIGELKTTKGCKQMIII